MSFSPILPENLWDHQKRAVEEFFSLSHMEPYYGLLFEQGTGKTLTLITILRNLFTKHGRPLKTLILCPQAVVDNWRREVDKFSQCGRFVRLLTGTKKERIATLEEKDEGQIFVTNFEALDMEGLFWTRKGESRITRALGFEVLVVDEAQRMRTHNAKRVKACIRMADKIFYRFILTGTPILNGPEDVWAQYRILDGGKAFSESFYNFRNLYFIDKNAGMPKDKHFPDWKPRPETEAAIGKLMYSRAMRVEKSECLDLPPLVQQRLAVAMSPQQQRLYDEMKRDFIAYLGSDAVVAQLAITKALRLMQLVSGFASLDDGTVKELPCPRYDALRDLLDDHARTKKVIVWASWSSNYAAVKKICAELGLECVFLTGEQSHKEKAAAIEAFTKGSARVLCSNPAAGGCGINLVEASLSIWLSRTFSLEQRLQAMARNHRGGSEIHDRITSIDLYVPGTIDELILDALDRKEAVAEAILGARGKI